MVKLFFGLPGCGKTTILTMMAYKALKDRRPRYKHVYSNVYLGRKPPFDRIIYIDKDDIGIYDISDGLLLLDECTLLFDSRDYKNFSKPMLSYFLLHRHYNVDIILFTQQWDGVDRKIRVITDRVYYVYKTILTGKWISKYYRIPYGIIIPDANKKNSGEKLGDIVQGYCKPSFFQRIFCSRVYRPKYYRFFDSWDAPKLPPLPQTVSQEEEPIFFLDRNEEQELSQEIESETRGASESSKEGFERSRVTANKSRKKNSRKRFTESA